MALATPSHTTGAHFARNMSVASLPSLSSLMSDGRPNMRAGRGIPLPKRTTRGLLTWLLEHHRDPFPTAREKLQLQAEFNLTPRQLSNWFINARRRVLKKLNFPDGDFVVTSEWIELAENLTRRGRRSSQ